jgi:3-oxoacyl-[acyl-carrier-protein] synthase II
LQPGGIRLIRRRTVITGLGVVCSGGSDRTEFTRTLVQGVAALYRLNEPCIDHFGSIYAGTVNDDALDSDCLPDEDRHVRLADKAMGEAIAHAGIVSADYGARCGLFLGTCSGPMRTIEEIYRKSGPAGHVDKRELLQKKQYYRAAQLLASRYGVAGPVGTVTTACSAFCAALTTATDLLRAGTIDTALVGGTDALSLTTLAGFVGLKAVSGSPCAPFSLPVGLSLGEGAAFIVVEELCAATARGAVILGEVEGYGLSNDAWHCSAPDPTGKGATAAMAAALADAHRTRAQVTYVNAHGTGTEANDKAEAKAIRRLFGQDQDIPPVSSTKAVVGHCLGAAGAIETVATLLCAAQGVVPASVNFSGSRDGCMLTHVANRKTAWKTGARWLKNNFAFGGNNASILFKNGVPEVQETGACGCIDEPVVLSAAGILSGAGIAPSQLTAEYFCKPCTRSDKEVPAYGTWPVCEVPPFGAAEIDRRFSSRGIDRAGLLATAAAMLALKNGRVPDRPSVRSRIGFFMSIAQGSSWAEREHIGRLLENRFHIDQIHAFPYIVPNAVTGTVARALTLTGYNNTFCNGPGASVFGFSAAWAAVKNRHVKMLLCGSVDDLTEEGLFDCVAAEQESAPRPILGEGSVMLLLEPQSEARRRGVPPLGTVLDVRFTTIPPGMSDELLVTFVERLLERHGIDRDCEIGVCLTDMQNRFDTARLRCNRPVFRVDQTPLSGWMPASQPMYDIVAGLVTGSIGKMGCAKYILQILRLPQGTTTVTLLRKEHLPKERLNE